MADVDRDGDARGSLRVVLVEDVEDARESLETLLRLRGCEVWSAADAAGGCDLIERRRPDLALIDIGLPDVPGYEVARRTRADADLAHTWLVALTGHGRDRDVALALEAGFDQHLVKPLDLGQLGDLLDGRRG